jgi:hypothetical protein
MFQLLTEQTERYHSSSKLFNGVPVRCAPRAPCGALPLPSPRANAGLEQPPPPSYVPPTGASPMTWPNIYKNLKRIDYCVDQFDYVRCAESLSR